MEKRGKRLLFLIMLLAYKQVIFGQDYQKALENCFAARDTIILNMINQEKTVQLNRQTKMDEALQTYVDSVRHQVTVYAQDVAKGLGKILHHTPLGENSPMHTIELPHDFAIKLSRCETNFWSEMEKLEKSKNDHNNTFLYTLHQCDTQIIQLFQDMQNSYRFIKMRHAPQRSLLVSGCTYALRAVVLYFLLRGIDLIALQYKIRWYARLKWRCIMFKNEQIRKRLIVLAKSI